MAGDELPIIRIEVPTEESRRLWEKAVELSQELGEHEGWTLIGGLMVQLHAFEHQSDSRLTDDIDVLGDSRKRPSMTRRIAELLERLGGRMEMPPTSNETLGYKFEVDGETVEILGPDGVRTDPKTIGKYSTFRVPGGTQALNRSEAISVSIEGRPGVAIRRPSLLGAILIKARVVAKKRKEKFDSDRQDLILLLSLVEDPRTLAAEDELKKTEQKWLRKVEKTVDFTDPALDDLFPPETLARASQAFNLLIRPAGS
ncbi:MAG TPA: hypothetical protein VK889_02905 [Solirubrobacterales bacterium]|nr:hypothetical protein [Solirubrobacterales bacterium]